ncbi:MAG TPA: cytochrome P450 [Candidatus Xenobia bacterium]|jgi:hypothetical protein
MNLFNQALEFENRPNPYPIYAQMGPLHRQDDGTWVATSKDVIAQLLVDPRLSSDPRLKTAAGRIEVEVEAMGRPPFLLLDPPHHDRLRRLVSKHFGPALIASLEPRIHALVADCLDRHPTGMDVIGDLAYPLPVQIICDILGVPAKDEPRFRDWSEKLADTLDLLRTPEQEYNVPGAVAHLDLAFYVSNLLAERRGNPQGDMLSALSVETEMSDLEIIQTVILLLLAGHETTVNLIGNGVLALLRFPHCWARLAQEADWIEPVVEEILRFDPPIQFRTRTALAPIPIDGQVIPAGAQVVLLLAAGQRDSKHFASPNVFDPDRPVQPLLAFGLGIHFCFGAPLARLEGRIALGELARRLQEPRLLEDPPPYRKNPALRGPSSLPIAYAGVRP